MKENESIPLACIGILLESATPAEVNRASLDLIAFKQTNPGHHMQVMTNFPSEFVGIGRVLGFHVMSLPDLSPSSTSSMNVQQKAFLQCFDTWKAYYSHRKPAPPSIAAHFYHTRVAVPDVEKVRISIGDPHYPVIERPANERLVPPGTTPNINKIPPRHNMNNWLPNPFWY